MKKTILTATVLTVLTMTAATADQRHNGLDFAALDGNGDGAISLSELQARQTARFSDADSDGDGALSIDELTASVSQQAQERHASRVARMIERLDENGDGLLQEAELAARGSERMERMFERADSDDDGLVTESEFADLRDRRGGDRGKRHDGGRGGRHGG
ncbi:EF-hand domain-containing protein [Yoonia sediminilitoris]|uniref:Ca2+-binding EF-hand superfamily protein n=1 Tax=Yoonia sediminilitoris TaxID=1286148 RepID=A0A2T6KB97_9RHOB|nr:EF-hand domain-containing protein [Yoonia sediminilitoris]PUB12091.1 Ca2+-binding EF-hand superfamily protein [Yoonia sediminilitoris]RCW92918.1 Ca2+-binding EF-hand superfamily protein [Yoonia sediminilitoris]